MNLSGRRVLLTGGSRGIGPVIAEALAREGAHLALAARSGQVLDQVAASLRASGARVESFAADLVQAEERERLVERVASVLGRIDVLVNNAAVENEGAFVDLSWETIQQTIEINLAAPVHLTRLVLPDMLKRSQGHVAHVASLAGKVGTPFDATYSGTKAALARWGEGLRREIAGSGVGVSTIFPGYVTELGMFSRSGLRAPLLVGSCTPRQVADAVRDAILHDRPDVIVNSLPLRPAIAMAEMFPTLGDWLLRKLGVTELQRRKLQARPPTATADDEGTPRPAAPG